MKRSKLLKAMLTLFGLTAVGIGGALLLTPIEFQKSGGVILENNASLLSEMRAIGGVLLVCGLVITSGAFVSRLTYASTALSGLLYLAYGLSRVLSIAMDGLPSQTLVTATVFELLFGLCCVWALIKYQGDEDPRPRSTSVESGQRSAGVGV